MRDGQGKKLSDEEVRKVKAVINPTEDVSPNQLSVDPARIGNSGAENDGEREDQAAAPNAHDASI